MGFIMVSKKLRLILSLSFIAVLAVGIIVCSIVDAAISGSLTWSLYPISSCIFAGCVLIPAVFSGKRGILPSMIMLTILIIPYLFVLDRITGTDGLILRVGAASAVIALAYRILHNEAFSKPKTARHRDIGNNSSASQYYSELLALIPYFSRSRHLRRLGYS